MRVILRRNCLAVTQRLFRAAQPFAVVRRASLLGTFILAFEANSIHLVPEAYCQDVNDVPTCQPPPTTPVPSTCSDPSYVQCSLYDHCCRESQNTSLKL